MANLELWELRAEFAQRLSLKYGEEVPAYNTLVEVSAAVNRDYIDRHGADAERLGSISRVTSERDGAIRVGSPQEMAQVARLFAAFGMHPVGFYDLRDASSSAVPVVSTAFRPSMPPNLAEIPSVFSPLCSRSKTTASSTRRCRSRSPTSSTRGSTGPDGDLIVAKRDFAERSFGEMFAAAFIAAATSSRSSSKKLA